MGKNSNSVRTKTVAKPQTFAVNEAASARAERFVPAYRTELEPVTSRGSITLRQASSAVKSYLKADAKKPA